MKALLELLREHRCGRPVGIFSVCSSHPVAIEAALRQARDSRQEVLIEATSNQVNQFGGYSGMTPAAFRTFVEQIATRARLSPGRVLLGGDHLGPNCWQSEPAELALQRSDQMIAEYVTAGFRKIHLDCSMRCADDPPTLTDEVIATRAARLCRISETAWARAGGEPPVYVIGTEVPVPGGAAEDLGTLEVTRPEAVTITLETHRRAFFDAGLEKAWERVVALVVQPGVEFDHHQVIDYRPDRAVALSRRIEAEPRLVYEAHSTDYQNPAALAALVRDHFAILKVGPGVTFALRETLWALADIERELGLQPRQPLKEVVVAAMHRDPRYWKSYYTDPESRAFDLQYSLSDRVRYYWNVPEVSEACHALLENLGTHRIPLTLLSQYLPAEYAAIREGSLDNEPRQLLLHGVRRTLRSYAAACGAGAVARTN
jgi:D-tagatose-1,6-bisphosphate aldolase subunit GatZ/KbaZ